ncbi:helix-turn-helix domain-containing protein [Chryseobacterium sp. Ch-15]|uniref:Helix-turn-helix domain-containing protein n=1 Tax=Chryseobacterium muglaense TaxID=2893752 RepID=A0A9Q3UWT6_9FLAO|nr:helix-turn-helix domain-containing protein [Chryseobacterium muglaense]MBD3904882.1 helix-turn-helix domain-containing protein [Chryseobacterium muglaense]MCC9034430.1 helix-turn-helix domain-containing protein [Chryseobacterium muglaense]MCM2554537.1 helix-turn-helix domain-containing protein [Chryseobacterium muglaense]
MRPNYNRIYQDLLQQQYPEKLKCPKIKEHLSRLDSTEEILKLNQRLFKQNKETSKTNQQLKTYDKKTMMKLLNYQKKHDFSTSFMSRKYNISRTTFSKWKKILEKELQPI